MTSISTNLNQIQDMIINDWDIKPMQIDDWNIQPMKIDDIDEPKILPKILPKIQPKDITILPNEIWAIINDYKEKMEIQDEKENLIKKLQQNESHNLYTLCYMIHNKYPRWKINQFKVWKDIGITNTDYLGNEKFEKHNDNRAIVESIANCYEVNSGCNDGVNWKYYFSAMCHKYKWGNYYLNPISKKEIIKKVVNDLKPKYGDNINY